MDDIINTAKSWSRLGLSFMAVLGDIGKWGRNFLTHMNVARRVGIEAIAPKQNLSHNFYKLSDRFDGSNQVGSNSLYLCR